MFYKVTQKILHRQLLFCCCCCCCCRRRINLFFLSQRNHATTRKVSNGYFRERYEKGDVQVRTSKTFKEDRQLIIIIIINVIIIIIIIIFIKMIITINLELIITIIINSIIANENNPVVKTNLRKKKKTCQRSTLHGALRFSYNFSERV